LTSTNSASGTKRSLSRWDCNSLYDLVLDRNDAIVGPSIFWEYAEEMIGPDPLTNEHLYAPTPVFCNGCTFNPLASSVVVDGHDMGTGAMQVKLGWFPDKETRKSGDKLRHVIPSSIRKKKHIRSENCTDFIIEMTKKTVQGKSLLSKFKDDTVFRYSRRVCGYYGWLLGANTRYTLPKKVEENEKIVQNKCEELRSEVFVGDMDSYAGPLDSYCETNRPQLRRKKSKSIVPGKSVSG
jgi:hypothetical protein